MSVQGRAKSVAISIERTSTFQIQFQCDQNLRGVFRGNCNSFLAGDNKTKSTHLYPNTIIRLALG